jgi:hypothetical protein
MKEKNPTASKGTIPAVPACGWPDEAFFLLESCPNKLSKFSTARGVGPTKDDAEKAMKENALKDDLNCGSYTCKDGICEIDAVLFGDPVFTKSHAKSLKGRDVPDIFVCEQLFMAGCFCAKAT